MFFSRFQQLIDYQNTRKTQLRFCLFRQPREIFSFFRSLRKGKMVKSQIGLASLLSVHVHTFPLRFSLVRSLAVRLSVNPRWWCAWKSPYDLATHAQCCLLTKTIWEAKRWKKRATTSTHKHTATCTHRVWEEKKKKKRQQKVFIENTERKKNT